MLCLSNCNSVPRNDSVEEHRDAIDALAHRIQSLPSEIRWVYCQQDVIVATGKGVPVRPGVRTAQIGLFIKLTAKLGLELIAARVVSLIFLAALRCRQSRIPVKNGRPRYFVGISALRERQLVPQFEAMCGGPAIVVDERFSGALAAIYSPSTAELLRCWRDAARPVFADVGSDQSGGILDRSAVLTNIVRQLHNYAHFLAVFRGLNARNPGAAVAFSTSSLPAYAAARAGIEAIYFPHGVLTRSQVFPDFHLVVAFNAPEAKHLQTRLPRASVLMPPPVFRPIKVARCAAIVGNYGNKLGRSRDLIEFCRACGIDVVVRPHPADQSGYWKKWEGVSGVCVDRVGTLDEFLDRYRPCIMATWYSTPIYDALLRGVVPVSLEADQPDIVFPFAQVALTWPEHMKRVEAILADPKARYDVLTKAIKLTFEPQHVDEAIRNLDSVAL